MNGSYIMVVPVTEGWFALENIDLSGVASATINVGWQDAPKYSFDFEIKLDAADGKTIGKKHLPPSTKAPMGSNTLCTLKELQMEKCTHLYRIKTKRRKRNGANGG